MVDENKPSQNEIPDMNGGRQAANPPPAAPSGQEAWPTVGQNTHTHKTEPERVFGDNDPSANMGASPAAQPPRFKKPVFIAATGALLLLALVGGIAFLLSYYNSPLRTLGITAQKIQNVNSFGTDTSIAYEVTVKHSSLDNSGGNTTNQATAKSTANHFAGTAGLKGFVDAHDSKNVKLHLSVTASVEQNSYGLGKIDSAGDVIGHGQVAFFRLTKAPNIPIDLTKLTNKWIRVDSSDAQNIDTRTTEEKKQQQFTKQKAEKIQAIIKKDKLLVFKNLKDEKINGVATKHIGYTVNQAAFTKDAPQIAAILNGKPLSAEEAGTMRDSLKYFHDFHGELWIGQKDSLPYRLSSSTTLDQDGTKILLNTTATFKDFNKDFTVTDPTNTLSLTQARALMLDGKVGMATPEEYDARRRNELKQYQSALARYAAKNKGNYPLSPLHAISATNLPYTAVSDTLGTFMSDPRLEKHYYYVSDGKSFGFCADLGVKPGTRIQVGPTKTEEVAGTAKNCTLLN